MWRTAKALRFIHANAAQVSVDGLDDIKNTISNYVDKLLDYTLLRKQKSSQHNKVDILNQIQQEMGTPETNPEALDDLITEKLETLHGYENYAQWKHFNELRGLLWELNSEPQTEEEIRHQYKEHQDKLLHDIMEEMKSYIVLIEDAANRAGIVTPIRLEPNAADDEEKGISLGGATVYVGTSLLSVFIIDGKTVVDDINEDEDLFESPRERQDYFLLVQELQEPGSTQKDKWKTLYTARPAKDRAIYDAGDIPQGIFFANNLDHVDGLAHDLGSNEVRDVWKMTVNLKDFVKTLDGPVAYYQSTRATKAKQTNLLSWK